MLHKVLEASFRSHEPPGERAEPEDCRQLRPLRLPTHRFYLLSFLMPKKEHPRCGPKTKACQSGSSSSYDLLVAAKTLHVCQGGDHLELWWPHNCGGAHGCHHIRLLAEANPLPPGAMSKSSGKPTRSLRHRRPAAVNFGIT
jgi:hypothetical protein